MDSNSIRRPIINTQSKYLTGQIIMNKVFEKVAELEYLIQNLNEELVETRELATQLRIIAERQDLINALAILKKTIKRYELTGQD